MASYVYYVDTTTAYGSPDGSLGNEYSDLNEAEQARDGTIGVGDTVTISCKGSTADANAVNVVGWTFGDANATLTITVDSAHRAGTAWSTSKYRVSVAGQYPLQIQDDYVRMDGLQIESTDTTANQKIVNIASVAAANYIRVTNCFARTHTDTTTFATVFAAADSGNELVLDMWNCIAHHRGDTATSTSDIGFLIAGVATANLYNCTAYGGGGGFRVSVAGTVTLTNCLAQNTGTADFAAVTITPTVTYCLSEDSTSDIWSATGNIVDKNVVFVSETDNYDFAIDAADTSGAKTEGTSLAGTFTTDILGTTRSDWGIGAHELASGTPAVVTYSTTLTLLGAGL